MEDDSKLCSEYEYYYNIASAVKTIQLIELLVQGNGELSVTEIARALDTHTSSADRYLLTLQNLGYAEKNPRDGKFRMSDKLIMLNNKLIANHPLTTKSLDAMHTLAYEFDTTAHIMSFFKNETITLHKDLQTHNLSFNKAFFDPTRYHYCSAPGKLLLSTLSEEDLKEYFLKVRFIKFTKNTLASEKAVRENLALIRSTGYSVHDEEWLPGNLTIAFPLCLNGEISGSLSLMCDISMKDRMLSPSTIAYIKSKLGE